MMLVMRLLYVLTLQIISRDIMNEIKWSRRGGYEVSSKGDKRFSAFYAVLSDGRSIEQHYQCDIKGYDVGGTNWKLGKGKPPLDSSIDLYQQYKKLWIAYLSKNPELIVELLGLARSRDNTLSDCFASSEINQARALADILNDFVKFKENRHG